MDITRTEKSLRISHLEALSKNLEICFAFFFFFLLNKHHLFPGDAGPGTTLWEQPISTDHLPFISSPLLKLNEGDPEKLIPLKQDRIFPLNVYF